MGLHTIHFTWNISFKDLHKIEVTRIGRMWTDTLEIRLDSSLVASPTVNALATSGFFRGKQQLFVDAQLMEIWWKYGLSGNGDPESIVLICDNKIIARYGNSKASKSASTPETISPENLIPLTKPDNAANTNYANWSLWQKWLSKITGQFGSPALPPSFTKIESPLALDALGREVGFQDDAFVSRLVTHSQHLKRWKVIWSILYIGPVLVILLLFWVALFSSAYSFFFDNFINDDNLFVYSILLFPLIMYILFFGIGTVIQRIALLFSRRFEIDALCVTTIIYILTELKQDDVLIHQEKRQILVARISYLAQQTRLLAERYQSKSKNNQRWAQEHFRNIEAYLWERERWVHAPIASTLQDLRRDMHKLAHIYLTGLYGEFTYQPSNEIRSEQQRTTPGVLLQRAAQGVLRIVGSMILPIALLIIFFPRLQGQEKMLGVLDPQLATLLLIIWFALGLDSALNLGIVANLANVAKGIRELK